MINNYVIKNLCVYKGLVVLQRKRQYKKNPGSTVKNWITVVFICLSEYVKRLIRYGCDNCLHFSNLARQVKTSKVLYIEF